MLKPAKFWRQLFYSLPLGLISSFGYTQNLALVHSGTAYDAFENPVHRSFTSDLSRKYSINLLPEFSGDFIFSGDNQTAFKNLLFGNGSNSTSVSNSTNVLTGIFNLYLAQFRLYPDWKYHREMGFSIQLRNTGQLETTNGGLTFVNNYKNFGEGVYSQIFNSKINNQLFYQLGFSFRENYNKKWAYGGKISFLAGQAYSKLDIYSSSLTVQTDEIGAGLSGSYISSFGTDKVSAKTLVPSLKNPGISLSLGTSYLTKNNYYLSLNLKDLGFIHWNKSTSQYHFQDFEVSANTTNSDSVQKELRSKLAVLLKESETTQSHTSYLSPELTFAISRYFGNYHPVLVVDQFFYNGPQTNIALLNNLAYRRITLGINGIYNLDSGFQLGGNLMIKSPNAEFFIGSNRLLPTYYFGKGYLQKDAGIGKSITAANIFMGLNMKFGRKVQSPDQADFVDGLNDEETGFVYRLSKKEKRAAQKEKKKVSKRRKRR